MKSIKNVHDQINEAEKRIQFLDVEEKVLIAQKIKLKTQLSCFEDQKFNYNTQLQEIKLKQLSIESKINNQIGVQISLQKLYTQTINEVNLTLQNFEKQQMQTQNLNQLKIKLIKKKLKLRSKVKQLQQCKIIKKKQRRQKILNKVCQIIYQNQQILREKCKQQSKNIKQNQQNNVYSEKQLRLLFLKDQQKKAIWQRMMKVFQAATLPKSETKKQDENSQMQAIRYERLKIKQKILTYSNLIEQKQLQISHLENQLLKIKRKQ